MDLTSIPRWALIGIAVIGMLAVGGIGTWAGANLQEAINKNVEQDRQLDNHELRIEWNESGWKTVNEKLDKLLSRSGP